LERLTGGAIVEISRGAYDIWIEVTCQIISARTVWGSLQSDGLLTQAKPGLLECEVYDPDRLLDPTNNQGPYFAMLKPGLWIRLSYDDGATRTVVSYARVDTIEHQIVSQTGRIRANDWVSWLSNIQFPNDVLGTLPSWTGYQNAHSFATALLTQVNASAAVDEFQHPITVESMHGPVYITPKETPFVIGSPGPAIWDHFTEMVESQLYYIWIDRANVLRFANKREPSLPGIRLGLKGPLALDFTGVITASGVLNLIENLGQTNYKQDRKSVDEWGIKSFRMARSWPANAWNPASEDEWLNLVIADRSQPSLEAMPLQIWPTSSAELKQLIAVKAMDLMTMQFDAPDPPINLFARCIGGQISVSAEGWSVELVGWVVINDQVEFRDLLM